MHHWAAAQAGTLNNPRSERQFFDTCIAEATAAMARPDALGVQPLIVIANQYLAGSEDYQRFQARLLALSGNSKAMIAADSSHDGPMENPGVFVQAIREVQMAARNGTKLQ